MERQSPGRQDTQAGTGDGGTEAKLGEIPGEQLQVFYYICCVLFYQMGRSGQLDWKLNRPPVGEVGEAALDLDQIWGWLSHTL